MCNFDGASVMSGSKAGVQALMKVKQPGMIYVHCIAHVLELAVLDAIKSDEFLLEFEKTLESIFLMYYYSPKLAREIKDIAELAGEAIKHFGGMKKIRWVASRLRSLEALSNNYAIMTVHMEHLASQCAPSASDNYAKAISYLSNVKKIKFLQYLHFLIDFVSILRSMSLIFQKEKLLVCSVSGLVDRQIAKISNLKDVPGEAYCNFNNEVVINEDQNQIYKGVNLSTRVGIQTRRQLRIDDLLTPVVDEDNEEQNHDNSYKKVFKFLIDNAVTYIEKRFNVFKEEPLSLVYCFRHR